MVIACSLPYKMLSSELALSTLRTIRQHLLTPRGLRTLSPRNPIYRGSQIGTPAERDFAGKNGSVWPWLLSFYVAAAFDINGDRYIQTAEDILEYFEEDIQSYGIGSICELYDADPPYASRGAISQAWSVSAILDIYAMIRDRKEAAAPAKKAPAKKAAPKKAAAEKKAPAKKVATPKKKETKK
jgi:glycogen debranching enzyme